MVFFNESPFGRIDMDQPQPIEGWEGQVPHLDYWHIAYNHGKLTDEQKRFYDFVIKRLKDGIEVKSYIVQRYLLLYRDQLLKASKRGTNQEHIIAQIKALKDVYRFTDSDLNALLEKANNTLRERRTNIVKRSPEAQWVEPGVEVDFNGRTLTRGGFYLGSHLSFTKYNPSGDRFLGSSTVVEGPVVNPDTSLNKLVDTSLINQYSTYLEMKPEMQEALLDWLSGKSIDIEDVLIYYLAGIEFRLLADIRTTDQERINLIMHLDSLLDDASIKGSSLRYDMMNKIRSLIDFTLARFFTLNADSITKGLHPAQFPLLRRAKLTKTLLSANIDQKDDKSIIEHAINILSAANPLPDVYQKAYEERLRDRLRIIFGSRGEWIDPATYQYKPLSSLRGYYPRQVILDGLQNEAYKSQLVSNTLINKIAVAQRQLRTELDDYLNACDVNATPLVKALTLPHWLDPMQMPGVKEHLAKIVPSEHEGYKMINVGDLLVAFGYGGDEDANQDLIERVNMDLYRLGLRMGYVLPNGGKLKREESVGIFANIHNEIPRRGTTLTMMVTAAWMLTADKIKDQDLIRLDDWIDALSRNSDWDVPGKAVMRWLLSRKITLTQKRKAKITSMAKFNNKRDDFVSLLLSFVSDPEAATPKRMKRVETIYQLLGLDPTTIHSDIHRLATSTVKASKASKSSGKAHSIDKSKLKEMAQSTAKAQSILADVFEQQPEDQSQHNDSIKTQKSTITTDPTLEIIKLLINKSEWSRDDFDKLCRKYGETVGSMLERINDYSYENVDEAIAEDDDDTIYIDTDVAQQLI